MPAASGKLRFLVDVGFVFNGTDEGWHGRWDYRESRNELRL